MASNRTRNQDQILQTLKSLSYEIAAQDLYVHLQEHGHKIGLATVYRALDVLKQRGEIQVRTSKSGISLYGSLKRDHHHHLNCVRCGKEEAMDECPLQELQKQLNMIGTTTNFKVYYHTLEFYGVCKACQSLEDSNQPTVAPASAEHDPQRSPSSQSYR
ncbi:MAG: transcriptional repressor [Cyanobacteria bacterium P01_D01_bin.73]